MASRARPGRDCDPRGDRRGWGRNRSRWSAVRGSPTKTRTRGRSSRRRSSAPTTSMHRSATGSIPFLVAGLPTATIDEACAADTLLVLAPDLKEELPVLYLRVRDAVAEAPASRRRALTDGDLAHAARGGVAALPAGRAGSARRRPCCPAALRPRVSAPIGSRQSANVVVLVGRPSVAETEHADRGRDRGGRRVPAPTLDSSSALRRGNVRGAIDMGLAPGLLPGRVALDAGRAWFASRWGCGARRRRGSTPPAILRAAADGRIRLPRAARRRPALGLPRSQARRAGARPGVDSLIGVDTFLTPSLRSATVVLAAAGYAEKRGTSTNLEGRVSLLAQKVTPPGTARADWMIAAELAVLLERRPGRRVGRGRSGPRSRRSSSAHAGDLARPAPQHRWARRRRRRRRRPRCRTRRARARDGVVHGADSRLRSRRHSTPTLCGWCRPARSMTSASRCSHSPSLSGLASGRRAAHEPDRPRAPRCRVGGQVKVTSSRTTVADRCGR